MIRSPTKRSLKTAPGASLRSRNFRLRTEYEANASARGNLVRETAHRSRRQTAPARCDCFHKSAKQPPEGKYGAGRAPHRFGGKGLDISYPPLAGRDRFAPFLFEMRGHHY